MKYLWLHIASIFILTTNCYGSDNESDIGSFEDLGANNNSQIMTLQMKNDHESDKSDTDSDPGFITEDDIQPFAGFIDVSKEADEVIQQETSGYSFPVLTALGLLKKQSSLPAQQAERISPIQDACQTNLPASRKYSQSSDHTDNSASTISPQTSPIVPQIKATEATGPLHEKAISTEKATYGKNPQEFPMSPIEKNSRKFFTVLTNAFLGDIYAKNNEKKSK